MATPSLSLLLGCNSVCDSHYWWDAPLLHHFQNCWAAPLLHHIYTSGMHLWNMAFITPVNHHYSITFLTTGMHLYSIAFITPGMNYSITFTSSGMHLCTMVFITAVMPLHRDIPYCWDAVLQHHFHFCSVTSSTSFSLNFPGFFYCLYLIAPGAFTFYIWVNCFHHFLLSIVTGNLFCLTKY